MRSYHPPVVWPELVEPFQTALRQAVDDILENYTPVGIVAAGSILRGQGGPTSDIDLYVVHAASFRQRLQRRYNGVPFEIFVNPPHQVRRYFEEEHHAGRPITAHLMTTGCWMLDLDPVVQTLRNEAATWLATPPNPTPDMLRWRRYTIVDLLDNVRDVVDHDAIVADLMLYRIVDDLLAYRFLAANRNLPRVKATVAALAELDTGASQIVARFADAATCVQRLQVAVELAQSVIGVDTFFEWDSLPETLA
jgi:hypothetical protein